MQMRRLEHIAGSAGECVNEFGPVTGQRAQPHACIGAVKGVCHSFIWQQTTDRSALRLDTPRKPRARLYIQ